VISIHRRLLLMVLSTLALGAVALGVTMYFETLDDVGDAFDQDLRQIALAMADRPRHIGGPQEAGQPRVDDVPADLDYLTQSWTMDGTLLATSNPSVRLPFDPTPGVRRVDGPGGRWRVYTVRSDQGVVQAGQRTSSREELAAELATETLVPLALFIVLIAALTAAALRAGLHPLNRAAESVAQRSAASLEPVDMRDLPWEIHPLIDALNGLMQRVSDALTVQRRFVADAAHELRSPVTALRLQLQLLERSTHPAERAAALVDLRAGVERTQHVIEQLLQLSRMEPDAPLPPMAPVELDEVARAVVAQLSAKADNAGIDLGANAEMPLRVQGARDALRVMLTNLVDNALSYTPRGGVVDVHAERIDGRTMLRVVDNGPGIAPDERERVFDRFYRGTSAAPTGAGSGSGLGLAIVKAIAQRHGASVELMTGPSGRGLEVRVVMPPVPEAQGVTPS
jgi:signal transduction histidine kinase